jgi:hypothetical protein
MGGADGGQRGGCGRGRERCGCAEIEPHPWHVAPYVIPSTVPDPLCVGSCHSEIVRRASDSVNGFRIHKYLPNWDIGHPLLGLRSNGRIYSIRRTFVESNSNRIYIYKVRSSIELFIEGSIEYSTIRSNPRDFDYTY